MLVAAGPGLGHYRVVGEVQGEHGQDAGVTGLRAAARGDDRPRLTSLMNAALRASKRARSETTISTAGISLAQAGLGLAEAHLAGSLAGRHAVVLGTGSMGRLAARLLREANVGRLSVASRREARSAEAAEIGSSRDSSRPLSVTAYRPARRVLEERGFLGLIAQGWTPSLRSASARRR